MIKLLSKAVDLIADMLGGVLAGLIARRAQRIIARRDATPKATDAQQGWGELLLAAGLQGTTFALIKAAVDRGVAEAIRKPLGLWPSNEDQQPEKSAPGP